MSETAFDNVACINREYYAAEAPGRMDYWRLMAAPRFRMKTFLSVLRGMNPQKIADLGCGSGLLLQELAKTFPSLKLCGIDFSKSLIESNRSRDAAVDWRLADFNRRQLFPEDLVASFDVVIASEIIEHLDHPEELLSNAALLARQDGGMLILSTQTGRIWETERLVGHKRHFRADEMKALLEKTGWSPVKIWNAGFPFHDAAKRLANITPRRTMVAYSDKPYGFLQKLVCAMLRAAYLLNSKNRGAQLFVVARRA